MITKKIWYLCLLCLLPMMSIQASEEVISETALKHIELSFQSIVTQLEGLKEKQQKIVLNEEIAVAQTAQTQAQRAYDNAKRDYNYNYSWQNKDRAQNALEEAKKAFTEVCRRFGVDPLENLRKLNDILSSFTPPEEFLKLKPEVVNDFFPTKKELQIVGQKPKTIYGQCPGHGGYVWRPERLGGTTYMSTPCLLAGFCNPRTISVDDYQQVPIYTPTKITTCDGREIMWRPCATVKDFKQKNVTVKANDQSELNKIIDGFIDFFTLKSNLLETITKKNAEAKVKQDKAAAAQAERNEKFKNTGLKLGTTIVENAASQSSDIAKIKAQEKFKDDLFYKNLPRNAAIGTAGAAVVVTTFALAWHGGHVGFNELQKRLNKPKLIKETTRPENIWQMIVGKELEESRLDEFVWPDGLQTRLEFLIEQTIQAKEAESSFKNVLLYGPPGTGKTMFAKSLARASGVHYAMFSGADFNNFESLAEAQAELDNIISWGENSDKGLILFVDEADCFLVERTFPDTTPRQCALTNMFLSRVEKPSSNKIMWVFCTNNRGSLDIAVESRISEAYEFKRPSDKNGMQILLQYLEQRDVLITDTMKKDVTTMSSVLVGLSGRDIQEIAEEVARRLNVNNMTLDFDLIKTAIQEKKDNIKDMARAQDEYRRARYGKA